MTISDFLKRENNNLDLIRIILACLVIIGHAPILNGSSLYWIDPIGNFFTFTYSGALAVKLFFFISGLVVTNSLLHKRSLLHFIISRSFRLLPGLLILLIVTVFIFGPILTKVSIHEYFNSLDHFRYIKNNIVFTTDYSLPGVFNENIYKNAVNGSLWSLRYEVGCYILLLGLFLIGKNAKTAILNILIIAIIVDAFLPNKFIFSWLGDNQEINLLPASFAFGAFFAVNANKIKMDLSIVLGSFIVYYLFNLSSYNQILFVLASCNLVLYLASNKHILKLKPKYDISYGIYLWGFLIQQTVVHYTGHIYVGIHCLISLIICIVLALLSFIVIEKPFISIGKTIFESITKLTLKNEQ